MTKPINDGRFHKGHNDGRFQLADRFRQNYGVVPETECWIWLGPKNKAGYGKISHGSRGNALNLYAHRVSWQLHYGPIPKGLIICHRCDQPSCVNPVHLFIGTQADNLADRDRKGRNPRIRLTKSDVKYIRELPDTVRLRDIARVLGMNAGYLKLVRNGKIESERWL